MTNDDQMIIFCLSHFITTVRMSLQNLTRPLSYDICTAIWHNSSTSCLVFLLKSFKATYLCITYIFSFCFILIRPSSASKRSSLTYKDKHYHLFVGAKCLVRDLIAIHTYCVIAWLRLWRINFGYTKSLVNATFGYGKKLC